MLEVNNKMRLRSNGKLMLTGEYLVLKGARSLSLPLRFGQELHINEEEGIKQLSWNTNMKGVHWFDARFSIPEFAVANTNDFSIAKNLREILLAARSLNPSFLTEEKSYLIESDLEFDINWGFGSSSSLLVNIAQWAKVDPFDLHFLCSDGSAYDIASAMSDKAVIYQLKEKTPIVQEIDFQPPFANNLYFVYLGVKKKSNEAVKNFNTDAADYSKEIEEISFITDELSRVDSFRDFEKGILHHEKILSKILNTPEIGKTRFFDFKGSVKSLGAWGGDFVLLMTEQPLEYVTSYMKRKAYKTWFRYNDLVLNKKEINLNV
jgi:mevalonate kinase